MSQSALVHLYPNDSTGWVIAHGPTPNIQAGDPSIETVVPLNLGAAPDSNKPLWKQMVVAGEFESATSEIKDDAKVWLSTRFVSSKTVLFQLVDPTVIMDTTPVVLGSWLSDSRGGNAVEDGESRVFGAIFKWINPVAIRPPAIVLKGYSPDGVEKHSMNTFGEAIKIKTDSTNSYEFWKVVTAGNAPQTFRQWKIEISAPTLVDTETCTVESLRISRGFRGAI